MAETSFPPVLDTHDLAATVLVALEEDGAFRDVTTTALVPPGQRGRGELVAKAAGVVAGLPVVTATFQAVDDSVVVTERLHDGAVVEPRAPIAAIEGPLASVLAAERVALNFLQRLSGVATLTREMARLVADLPVKVLDTRKTTPGLRALERYAVRLGGGWNHRFNLSDGVLIKDNHLAAARSRGLSLAEAVREARLAAAHTLRIEVEVTSFEEAMEALDASADLVLLDNMSSGEMRRVVLAAGGRALFEASGGVTLANLREVAETGVDFISVGALTHSAPALDISLEVEPERLV